MGKNVLEQFSKVLSSGDSVINNLVNKIDHRVDSTINEIKDYTNSVIAFPYGSLECLEQKGFELANKLLASGFVNITMMAKDDLRGGFFDRKRDGMVSEILVNGKSMFRKHMAIRPDAPIVISYHTVIGTMDPRPQLLPVPSQYQNMTANTVGENISVEEQPMIEECSKDSSQKKFCMWCGQKIPCNSIFCSICGKKQE